MGIDVSRKTMEMSKLEYQKQGITINLNTEMIVRKQTQKSQLLGWYRDHVI